MLTDFLRRKDEGVAEPVSRDTLDKWINTWLTVHCTRQSARTRAGYRELLDRYLDAEIRSRRLAQLSVTDVQQCINGLSERGLGPRSVRAVHAALRKCLSDAVRVGKAQRNAAKGVALPALDHREMTSLTPQQAGSLIASLKGTAYEALFTVWIHTGLRPAEIAALKWDDFDGASLAVRRAFVRVEKTKRAIGSDEDR